MNYAIDIVTAGIHLPLVGACLALGVLLLLAPRNGRRSNRFSGCLLIVGALTCWSGVLQFLPGVSDIVVPWVRKALSACNFLYGPLLLFCINAEFARRTRLGWVHLFPFLVSLASAILFGTLFSSPDQSDLLWKNMRLIQSVHVGLYLLVVLIQFHQLSRGVHDRFANVYKIDIVAVRFSLFVFSLVYVVSMVGVLSKSAFLFLALVFFIFLGARSLIHPGLVGGDEDDSEVSDKAKNRESFETETIEKINELPSLQGTSSSQRSKKSGFREERIPEYLSRLKSLMLEEKIYEDSTLSLTKLAAKIPMGTGHLSELLNVHLSKNFFDFVNGYRVEAARHLLETHLSLNATQIAYEVGFNAKSTFYECYKRSFQCTPLEYRRRFLEKSAQSRVSTLEEYS